MYNVMKAENITYFNKKKEKIVENFSIDLKSEEIVEIYGEIGTGKTAVLEILHGMLKADKGKLEKKGKSVMVFKDIVIYQDLTVDENFEFFREVSRADIKKADSIMKSIGIDDFRKKRVDEIPEGIKRVVQIGCAMLGEFNIMFMDEPFSAMDTKYQRVVEEKLKEMKLCGKTVVYTTNNSNQKSYYDRRVVMKSR